MSIKVNRICTALIEDLSHNETHNENLSMGHYVSEYRTIGVIVPRLSGKSTYLESLHRRESSMLFVPNISMIPKNLINSNSVISFSGIQNLDSRFIGKQSNGLKFSCFLIDEFQFMTEKQEIQLYNLVNILKISNMIHEDFYILKLGT